MSKINKEKINQIIKLKKEGKTYKEIYDITGCCKNTCIKYLKIYTDYNVKKVIELTPDILKKIQQRYDKVKNIKKVAKEFGISYLRLRKCGLKLDKPLLTQEQIEAKINYSKKIKKQLIEYKGGKCKICGYNKCMQALEFHHLDPRKKDFSISGGTKSFKSLKPEVDKCILVCSNCHKEIHAGLITL